MSELAELRQDVRDLRQTIAVLCSQLGTRLSREQMCDRYQVSRNTLTRMIETGKVPRPVNGKWLLSELVAGAEIYSSDFEPPELEPSPIPYGEDGQHLYRHFDCDGRLLYVGISQSALHRLQEHRQVSHWFKHIARVEMTVYKTRQDVLIAERIAIKREKPLHNIMHSVIEKVAA